MSLAEAYSYAEEQLNAPSRAERLAAVRLLAHGVLHGEIPPAPATVEVNNHVHTCYSFSPHSPSSAAWHAQRAGLQAVGIMDHDSVAGVEEMLQAGAALGIATTAGFEVRVNFTGTPFAERVINGPGLTGIAYISLHGIPATQLTRCAEFLAPLQMARNARNIAMVKRLNVLLNRQGLPLLDFQQDVYATSCAAEGGTITERHILAALSRKIIDARGKGEALVQYLEGPLGITLAGRVRGYLLDAENPHYLYDLLGILKAYYTNAFFIHPDQTECRNVREVIALGEEVGAIPTYAYLGDVAESPTGDKKAEQFEDAFLDELMHCLRELGFRAITYMPPRNTAAQLARIKQLCEAQDFMQISGVDINSSRQTFNCPEILDPRFAQLITATWALIGHEKLSTQCPGSGLFSAHTLRHLPVLRERLALFAEIGSLIDPFEPDILPESVRKLCKAFVECGCESHNKQE